MTPGGPGLHSAAAFGCAAGPRHDTMGVTPQHAARREQVAMAREHTGRRHRGGVEVIGGAAHAVGSVIVALITGLVGGALAWFSFLSYGFEGGAYATWQVLGAALAFVAACVASRVLARARALWASVLGMTVGFAWPWVAWARSGDASGLWGVGALLLVAGLVVSGFVVGGVVDLALGRRRRR